MWFDNKASGDTYYNPSVSSLEEFKEYLDFGMFSFDGNKVFDDSYKESIYGRALARIYCSLKSYGRTHSIFVTNSIVVKDDVALMMPCAGLVGTECEAGDLPKFVFEAKRKQVDNEYRINHCLAAGVEKVFYLDMDEETVTLYEPEKEPTVVTEIVIPELDYVFPCELLFSKLNTEEDVTKFLDICLTKTPGFEKDREFLLQVISKRCLGKGSLTVADADGISDALRDVIRYYDKDLLLAFAFSVAEDLIWLPEKTFIDIQDFVIVWEFCIGKSTLVKANYKGARVSKRWHDFFMYAAGNQRRIASDTAKYFKGINIPVEQIC